MNSNNYQSVSEKTEQIIRDYQIITTVKKKEFLDTLLRKIETSEQKDPKPAQKITWYRITVISAAATIAILVSFHIFSASVIHSTAPGSTITHRLPDASRVVLHNESSIRYKKYYWNREVRLTGEAYFEVTGGVDFRVKTEQGMVEVLGTRFLVDARDSRFNVQCFQGKVKADYKKNSWILEQGMQFTGQDTKGQSEKIEKEKAYPDFALFSKSFANAPLHLVIKEVEAFFDVNIILEVPPGKNFTGIINTGNLDNVLQIVCTPLQLNYRIEEQHLIRIY